MSENPNSPYGYDCFHPRFTLASGENTIQSGGGATIPAGDYYQITGGVPSYPGFLDALETAIVSAASGVTTCTITAAAPTLSPQSMRMGIRIECDAEFDLDFSDPGWTLDPRLLGFPQGQTLSVSSSGGVITSPHHLGYVWAPPVYAAAKLRDNEFESYGEGRAFYDWREFNTREFEYLEVPAASVRSSRAAESPRWASGAGRGQGDVGGTLQDAWRLMRKGKPILVHHNGARSGDWNPLQGAGGWEVCRMVDRDSRRAFSALFGGSESIDRRGELYDVTFALEVIEPGTYDHS